MPCNVSIDLKPIDDLPELHAFDQLLVFINNLLKEKDRVITRIILNGEEVDEIKERELLNYKLTEDDYIEFYSAKPIDLAIDSFTQFSELLYAIVQDLKTAVSKLRAGEEKEGLDYVSDCIDMFQTFQELATKIGFLFFSGLESKPSEFKTFDIFYTVPDKLKDLTEALASQDTITTADLIEDDLIPIIQVCADEAPLILKSLEEMRDKN